MPRLVAVIQLEAADAQKLLVGEVLVGDVLAQSKLHPAETVPDEMQPALGSSVKV